MYTTTKKKKKKKKKRRRRRRIRRRGIKEKEDINGIWRLFYSSCFRKTTHTVIVDVTYFKTT
jgi:hypothetical protein